mmetsp:Transcript_2450/g.3581  ORF Transcript_2450/g.3581 Transcript_2450/m.3581 type:complete len:243 (-) Transcript_2450:15-743(-)
MKCLKNLLQITVAALFIISTKSSLPSTSISVKSSLSSKKSEIILRVRNPDGSIKRINASLDDPLSKALEKNGCECENGVATDKNFECLLESEKTVGELELSNGSWIYLVKDPSDKVGSNAEAIKRMKKRRDRETKGGGVVECLTLSKLDSEIKAAGKGLVIVDFFADWCGPCKAIAPKFKAMAQEFPKTVFLKVNVDKNKAASERYSVSSMPTFVFLKKGRVVDILKGADESTLRSKVKSYE